MDELRLPVLLSPMLTSCSTCPPEADHAARLRARTARAWGRFRQAAVSSFAFVEAAGPVYGWKLAKDALGLGLGRAGPGGADLTPEPAPRLAPGLRPAQKLATGAAVLKAMGLACGQARLVLVLGHGARVANTP